MSWEHWINRETGYINKYDETLEGVSIRFNLAKKTRAQEVVDVRQYVVKWFMQKKWRFYKYKTSQKAAPLIGLKTHSSLTSLNNYRIPSKNFEKNTKIVASYLKDY